VACSNKCSKGGKLLESFHDIIEEEKEKEKEEEYKIYNIILFYNNFCVLDFNYRSICSIKYLCRSTENHFKRFQFKVKTIL